ncbi:putative N-acetylmuramoyl-L-alanine amidase [Bacillus sp. TS-2]|nr:putative N-acetylmuramoyl-L-alanine amidase [Bacillus sp. TS-2]
MVKYKRYKIIAGATAFLIFFSQTGSVFAVSQDYSKKQDDLILKMGVEGPDVLELEEVLKSLGYAIEEPDQTFDEMTEEFILEYQKINDLEITGEVDRETFLYILEEALLNGYKKVEEDEGEDEAEETEEVEESEDEEETEEIEETEDEDETEETEEVEETEDEEETEEIEETEDEYETEETEEVEETEDEDEAEETEEVEETEDEDEAEETEEVEKVEDEDEAEETEEIEETEGEEETEEIEETEGEEETEEIEEVEETEGKDETEKTEEVEKTESKGENGKVDDKKSNKIDIQSKVEFSISKALLNSDILADGVRDARVIELKIAMGKIGYSVPGNNTNHFGPVTANAVRELQSALGYSRTGSVDLRFFNEILLMANGDLFKNGIYHKEVITLKNHLATMGLTVSNNPTEHFGPQTAQQVREFQRTYNLPSTGIADKVTIDLIHSLATGPMRINMHRDDVIQLKLDLEKAGYKVSNNPNNYFGTQTEKQVKELQRHHGLNVTGIVDKQTSDMIKELTTGSLFDGVRHQRVIDLKNALSKIGYTVPGNNTNHYGPATAGKVKELQVALGYQETGKVDTNFYNEIMLIAEGNLFKNGIYHNGVIKLKEQLAIMGFSVSRNPTVHFGPETERQVRSFQAQYGITQTGIADQNTMNRLNQLATGPLREGMHRSDVIQLKIDLAALGYHISNNPTEHYGSQTAQQVEAFQREHGLAADGIAGPQTLNKINELKSSILMDGVRHANVIQLKRALALVGYPVPGNNTNHYGPQTEKVVKNFQSALGLNSTGVVDQNLYNEILKMSKGEILRQGMYHSDVIKLKEDLAKVGFSVSNNPNNYFGPQTAKQVTAFQRANGLTSNGIADVRTQNKLAELVQAQSTTYTFTVKQQFGHGVGMTQYGAYGMSQAGYSYNQILNHYYTNVSVGRDAQYANTNIRVALNVEVNSKQFNSSGRYNIVDSQGRALLSNITGNTTITYGIGGSGEYSIQNGGRTVTTKNEVKAVPSTNSTSFNLNGREYKGELNFLKSIVSSQKSNFVMDVVNTVNIDTYLQGVVPYEMIVSWAEIEAFKAQAVAARTYALFRLKSGGNFDVYDDTRSQVYHGVPDAARNNALVNRAIFETSGVVIKYNNRLIDAIYSASASGHTVDASMVWGNDVAYLKGVPDPYDQSRFAQSTTTTSITLNELSEIAAFKNRNLGKVTNLSFNTRFERLIDVQVTFERGRATYTVAQFRDAIGRDKLTSNIISISVR